MENNSGKFHWHREAIKMQKKKKKKTMCRDKTGTLKEKRIAFKNAKSEQYNMHWRYFRPKNPYKKNNQY